MNVGDKVEYKTDKAYKYSGYRFQIRKLEPNGDIVVGNSTGLIEIVIAADLVDSCVRVVKSPHNKAIYE